MKPLGALICLLVIALPVAWFISEFQVRRWLRLVLGTLAIASTSGVAVFVGMAERFNDNAWFGNASKALVETTIAELEAGNRDGVLRALRSFQQEYAPTYENRARYDVLVEKTVSDMRASRPTPELK